NRRIHYHDIGKADDGCDRCDIADEIEIEFVVKGRVDCVRWTHHEQHIAVSGLAHDGLGVDVAAAPGRFSMMNCWPSRSDNHCPTSRAVMSVAPAGPTGTIKRTGRDG